MGWTVFPWAWGPQSGITHAGVKGRIQRDDLVRSLAFHVSQNYPEWALTRHSLPAVSYRWALFVRMSSGYWVDERRGWRINTCQLCSLNLHKEKHFPKAACNLQSHPPHQALTLFHKAALLFLWNWDSLQSMGNKKQFIEKTSQGFHRTTCPGFLSEVSGRSLASSPPFIWKEGVTCFVSSAFFPLTVIPLCISCPLFWSMLQNNFPMSYNFINILTFIRVEPYLSALGYTVHLAWKVHSGNNYRADLS